MSSELEWSDIYKLGIDEIDAQHHKLFDIVHEIFALSDHPGVKEEIKRIFYELSAYMATHFADEERYMQSIGFPELEAHRQRHEQIIIQTANILKTTKPSAGVSIIKTKMKVAAKQLLVDHIVNEDMKIKLYLAGLRKRDHEAAQTIIALDEL
ncbi:MAG: hemerythrin family protein [Campylobacterales bacterium]|nr:hemerythrin family protein [Campylobacterales bacterium]